MIPAFGLSSVLVIPAFGLSSVLLILAGWKRTRRPVAPPAASGARSTKCWIVQY